MPPKGTKILTFTKYHKSNKAPATIYADLESSITEVDKCKSNSEKAYSTKVAKYIPLSFQCLSYRHLMV